MKWDENGECYVAESKNDFVGYKYLGKRKFKDGVWIVSIMNDTGNTKILKNVITATKHLPNVNEMCV